MTARLGSTSERFDFGVLTSPVRLADRQTWMTALSRSTWSQASLRSSPGRRPSVIDSTNSASSLRFSFASASSPRFARQNRQVVVARSVPISMTGAPQARPGAARQLAGLGGRVGRRVLALADLDDLDEGGRPGRRRPGAPCWPAPRSWRVTGALAGPAAGRRARRRSWPMRSYFCARRIDLTSVLLIFTSDWPC